MNPKDKLGVKKVPLHLIPPSALIEEAMCMSDGAKKYGPYNWREEGKPVTVTIYVAAALRHLLAFMDGEDLDPDSGHSHLGHNRAGVGVLIDAMACGNAIDDRPPKGPASKLLEQHALKTPTIPSDSLQRREEASDKKWIPYWLSGNIDPCIPEETNSVEIIKVETNVKTAYVAGPMRGYDQYNFPAFDAARDLLNSQGWNIISPADMDRAHGLDPTDPATEAIVNAWTRDDWKKIIARDVEAILSLNPERGDAVAMLPGWERSTGAVAEFFLARWCGLAVIDGTTGAPLKPNDVQYRDLCKVVFDFLTAGDWR